MAYASKYKELERQHKEVCNSYDKQVKELREKLARYSAKEMIDSQKKVLAPLEERTESGLFKYRKVGHD